MQINQYNDKRERHGYWEWYYPNGKLMWKGSYKDGKQDGYWEWYNGNGKLWYKGSYKNGERDGYWEWYSYSGKLIKTRFYARN
jgi:uncharacterized protein